MYSQMVQLIRYYSYKQLFIGKWYPRVRSIYPIPVQVSLLKNPVKVAKKLCTAPMPVQGEHKHILLKYTA